MSKDNLYYYNKGLYASVHISETKDKEIERLNAELELYKDNQIHLINQLEQKDNIIKEVREYIEEHTENVELNIYGMPPVIRSFRGNTQTLLEILERANNDK